VLFRDGPLDRTSRSEYARGYTEIRFWLPLSMPESILPGDWA
jgi:hypothetical protein